MNSQTFYKTTGNAIAAYLLQELNMAPGVHWRIQNATSGPRVLSLNLLLNPKFASKIVAMAEPLSMAAMLDKDASIRIGRGNRGTLCLEIPKPSSLWYNIGVNQLPKRRGLLASVGLDNEHRPALIDFANALTPHCLTAGATGSGKTNVSKLLVYDLASQNEPDTVNFVLIDVSKKGKNWRPFASLPHLLNPIIVDDPTALRALAWAIAEMDRRAESGRVKPHIFFAIDEAQELLDREEFVKVIRQLSTTGREFGIHLLAAMQDPTARQLGDTTIKRNLQCRLVGKVDSATAAVVATGLANTGAEKLMGSGDMLLVQPAGVKRLTAALLTDRDTDRLPHSETVQGLDLGEYEDVDHVVGQADNGGKVRADDFDPRQVAVALVAERGITWLCNRLSIGSTKAKRILDFANELRDELIAMDAYTTIPPDDSGERNGPEGDVNGMVVCRYKEVDDDQLPEL